MICRSRRFRDFPAVDQFLNSNELADGHCMLTMGPEDPILPALEYFLSLKGIKGIRERRLKLAGEPVERPNTNRGILSWAGICAELGAIRLLGKELRLKLTGFDAASPRRVRKKSDCDIRANVEGASLYFEVKRNAKEDAQMIPTKLAEALAEIGRKHGFSLVPQLKIREYDCQNLDAVLSKIEAQIIHKPYTPMIDLPELEVMVEKETPQIHGVHFFSTPLPRDVSSWLIEEGHIGKDGKPMTPMAKQAQNKGADYLMCRVPAWDSLHTIINRSLSPVTRIKDHIYESADPRLGTLSGIVFFHKYDRFSIVNRSNSALPLLDLP